MIRVLLIDDHRMVRDGLQRILEQTSDIAVVGAVGSGKEALEVDASLEPDVVMMDISMPGLSGIETTRLLCAQRPGASVVMLTATTDRHQVVAALDAGAIGFLVKDAEPQELIAGIRDAANGEAPLDSRAARVVIDLRHHRAGPHLTDRERQVLELVRDGLANKTIASRLGISEKTVKTHLTSVYATLEVSGRTQAALWAAEHLPESASPDRQHGARRS